MTNTAAETYARVDALVRDAHIGVATVADVLDHLRVPRAVLPTQLRRLGTDRSLFHGAARPVQWSPVRKGSDITRPSRSTWEQVADFIVPSDTTGVGQIYCAGAGPILAEAALLGGLSTTYLTSVMKFEGIILGGALRDTRMAESCSPHIVYSNATPADTQGAYYCDASVSECIIESTVIRAGDWIFSDADGSVVCPLEQLETVLGEAARIEEVERSMLSNIRSGERLSDIVERTERI